MAAYFVSRLNPTAPPFMPPMALANSKFCATTPAVLLPADLLAPVCLYSPPPPPPAFFWPVACSGCWGVNGCICTQLFMAGAPAFPPPAACVQVQIPQPPPVTVCYTEAPPPTQPATRCRITEIGEDGSDEAAKDEPSPRSVLPIRSRKLPTMALPPRRAAFLPPSSPPRLSLPGKASRRRSTRASANNTSLMIRNIPNRFMKNTLKAILDKHCAEENAKLGGGGGGKVVKSEYDFLYVPIDFRTKCNKGYAFVNMTTAAAAKRLHAHLHGHGWLAERSRKVCDVVHASTQGLDALVALFSGSLFPCGDEELLPVRFQPPRDGVRATAEHVIGRVVPGRRTG